MKKIIRLTEDDLTKLIKRTINEIREDNPYDQLKKFLESNIEFEGYGIQVNQNQKISQLFDIFMDEYGLNIEDYDINERPQLKNKLKKKLVDWLQGLPSAIDIPYYYYDISNLLHALGFDDIKEMEDDELSDFYYSIVADTILENK